ncbi:TonB-dependent receptor SusC [Bacteroides pyogenes]|nr:TonB-dependent receptor SusC [Bacteroides pyogenes]MBR8716176.1 TonB-dependent receptor SusC [Bacteroides pyogenes]MBR8745689.1 TonB-dependent receptor SusC [Bacteroides pyogenes]MBR8756012.1 TonB-dependent receptor SusC [Bacteroides pyogenes]MBR8779236.1 TonB-dependent receptor SusC [Bacteroides pyogenes]
MKRVTSLLLFFASLLLSVAATAQDFSVKGKVTDATGQPVIGANIKVKEAQTGVITDMDGNFIISVPSKHKELIVSFIGYKSQTVKVAPGMGMVQIQLKEDAQSLDEIVIIGYGTQKKSSLTSSVETIKKEDLLQMPTANLDEALSGQVAGLQVMSSTGDPSSAKEASMRIRAVSGAQNAPLLVIDGVPRFSENTSGGEARLSDLNPDDIESISILKDAAAAAVYGVRAANGVILVKTKRGSGDSKIRVNYRGQFNIQKGTQFPKFLNSYEFAKLYNRAVEGVPNTEPFTDEELEMIRTQSHPNEFADSNMLDYLKKQGHSTTHAISLSGGNNLLKYYISGAYTNTVGLYSGVGRDRYN